MTNERVRSVGGYTMRILGVVFIVGGAFLLKRSGAAGQRVTPTA
ncbi:hypothetical protein ONO23_01576 [Micromonospora noduli]|uniref:Uncharacterized protein n=1 Tax=Micromonospora noduli TaxID=709876 RepID=A0ABX9CXR4_9ACTN|nr:hypothetical protein [Micromonospora noduli]RAO14378.1 hypothetical protein MED15_04731 [Micromonospora noduli]RAO33761.1 hypothetical protein ONO86_04853 [Micromonospora noduli]RAO36519.1 hypothetical protein ONO23_01576 [Micromonospora noduli]